MKSFVDACWARTWCSCCGKRYGGFSGIKSRATMSTQPFHSWVCAQKNQKQGLKWAFAAAWLTAVHRWKQPTCPPGMSGYQHGLYAQDRILLSLSKEGHPAEAVKWRDVEDTALREMSRSQKGKYHTTPLT